MSRSELNSLTPLTATSRAIMRKYSILSRQDRLLLAAQMKSALTLAFNLVSRDCEALRYDLGYIDEVITSLSKKSPDSILARQKAIQQSLNNFFTILEEIREYSIEPISSSRERKLGNTLEDVTIKLNTQINKKLSRKERSAVEYALRNQSEAVRLSESPFLFLNLKRISPAFHEILADSPYQPLEEEENLSWKQDKERLLGTFSADLLHRFQEVDALLMEAKSFVSSPDDEYFVEQVAADYYPQIFESVKKVVHSSADLTQRETVVAECLEQFQIIQIGLNQIIDSGLTDNTKSLKSQTEFLRSKIVGSRSLVLSPDEGQMVPVSELHQLRAAYEAKIQEMEEEHKAEIRNLYARYEPSKLSTCARLR